jgi:hypothetical protein
VFDDGSRAGRLVDVSRESINSLTGRVNVTVTMQEEKTTVLDSDLTGGQVPVRPSAYPLTGTSDSCVEEIVIVPSCGYLAAPSERRLEPFPAFSEALPRGTAASVAMASHPPSEAKDDHASLSCATSKHASTIAHGN